MKIGIVGAGFVGLTFAAVLGSKKYDVILADSDEKKIKSIDIGNPPFYEPKLKELLKNSLKKSLKITKEITQIIDNCEIIFITVGTPSLSDGKIDLSNISYSPILNKL